jgi:hypothetical protein
MFKPSERPWMGFAVRPNRSSAWRGATALTGRRLGAGCMILAALCLAWGPSGAQEHVLVQGLTDAEIWYTDPQSNYLSRNEGETASAARLRLWAVGEFMQNLQGFVLGAVEGGKGSETGETDTRLEQAYLRYSFDAPKRMVLQAGKLSLPYGNFSRRYFSSQNPLIGTPLNYEISYPLGFQISGAVKRFDFMAAALDGPLTHQEYDSPTESSVRPALAIGVTPLTGFRIGAYFTKGPYLSRISENWLLPGKELNDFKEMVSGLDVQFSRAHFELNGELTQIRLQVPATEDAWGRTWYVEPKYTFSPRWYAALRWERGDLPWAYWIWNTMWSAEQIRINDLEAGIGFRIVPGFLVKTSYRTEMGKRSFGPDPEGHALALQLSYSFDVNSWFQRPR